MVDRKKSVKTWRVRLTELKDNQPVKLFEELSHNTSERNEVVKYTMCLKMRIRKVNILRIVFTVDQNKGRKRQEMSTKDFQNYHAPPPKKKIYYLVIFTQNTRAFQGALVYRAQPPMQEPRETRVPSLGGKSPGGGQGNPLQYSSLENPMDRGAWWATVHRVTKSQTWLTRLSTHGLVSYQGNQQRGMTRTTTLIRVTSWAWGQVHRKVSCVNGCRRSRHWSGRARAETNAPSPGVPVFSFPSPRVTERGRCAAWYGGSAVPLTSLVPSSPSLRSLVMCRGQSGCSGLPLAMGPWPHQHVAHWDLVFSHVR